MSLRVFTTSALVAAIAASFCAPGPAMSGEFPSEKGGDARYRPIQNISYTFGSKAISGYFVERNSVCLVTLMVIERLDPDLPSQTAVRIRLMLDPSQVAGLDSEEGQSLNFTCAESASALVVNYGETSKLMVEQGLAVTKTIAERVQR